MMCTHKKVVTVCYNIIITYERYLLDIVLNVSLQNSFLTGTF